MAIEYLVDYDKYNRLAIFKGDYVLGSNEEYYLDSKTIYGSNTYYVRSFDHDEIKYTIVPDKLRPSDYLVYRGSSVLYGDPIEYYVQTGYKPYIIVRRGSDIYGEEVFTVQSGKGCQYVVETASSKTGKSSLAAADAIPWTKFEKFVGYLILALVVYLAFRFLEYNPALLIPLAGVAAFIITRKLMNNHKKK